MPFIAIKGAFNNTSHEAIEKALEHRVLAEQHLEGWTTYCQQEKRIPFGYAGDIVTIVRGKFEETHSNSGRPSLSIISAEQLSWRSIQPRQIRFPLPEKGISSIWEQSNWMVLYWHWVEGKIEVGLFGITLDTKFLWNGQFKVAIGKATSGLMLCRRIMGLFTKRYCTGCKLWLWDLLSHIEWWFGREQVWALSRRHSTAYRNWHAYALAAGIKSYPTHSSHRSLAKPHPPEPSFREGGRYSWD